MTISEIMFLVSNSILSLVTVKSLASNCTILGLYLRLKTTLQWTLVVAQVSQMTRITFYLYQSLGITHTKISKYGNCYVLNLGQWHQTLSPHPGAENTFKHFIA